MSAFFLQFLKTGEAERDLRREREKGPATPARDEPSPYPLQVIHATRALTAAHLTCAPGPPVAPRAATLRSPRGQSNGSRSDNLEHDNCSNGGMNSHGGNDKISKGSDVND